MRALRVHEIGHPISARVGSSSTPRRGQWIPFASTDRHCHYEVNRRITHGQRMTIGGNSSDVCCHRLPSWGTFPAGIIGAQEPSRCRAFQEGAAGARREYAGGKT
jgi:hypothetical protein